jgi:DNA mismatch repair protein MutS2
LPEPVIARAESMLDRGGLQVETVLDELAREREAAAREREELARALAEVAHERERLGAQKRRELESASDRQTRAHAAAAAELRALQAEIKALRKSVRAGEAPPATDEIEARVAAGRPPAKEPIGAPPDELAVGDRVRVETLGADGEVLAVKGDKVTIQLPGGRTVVSRSDLRAASTRARERAAPRARGPEPRSEASRHFGADAIAVRQRVENTVDVRGERADDAIARVEAFLAHAIERDEEVVIVLHGHGSGALRKALREHLPRLRHVARVRAGLAPEGGDGVTVVWVRS